MFRRILPGREAEALAFLSKEPDINHFILGDIECFGLADPNLGLWVGEGDRVCSALLKYYGSFIIYAPGGADWRHAARIMRDCGYGMLSGRPEYVHPILEHLGSSPVLNANVFMKLDPGMLKPAGAKIEAVNVNLGNLDEYLSSIISLRNSISEFSMSINVEALREELKLGCKRIIIALEGKKAVSMVMTTVERRQAAMIVSVCTRLECRGRGYAPALMSELCRQLASEGKTALLFYSNPVAGRIYSSLGFQDIGRWCFASFA